MSNSGDSNVYNENLNRRKEEALQKLLNTNTTTLFEDSRSSQPLILRDYQTELACIGLKGENVLICAPTGSGKTIVAVKIVEEHLKTIKGAKVVFLVDKVALVDQQESVFAKYLKNRIIGMSGGSKSTNTPLLWNLENADIFILTADIFRTALETQGENQLKSINTFSMVIFDECHNVDNNHSYNRIMDHYFKEKKNNNRVPQIIGLTASIGTDKAKSLDDVLSHMFNICANLDTLHIADVEYSKDELQANQSIPEEGIFQPLPRINGWFDCDLQNLMQFCEESIRDLNKREFFPQTPDFQDLLKIPKNRMRPEYSNFLSKLDNEIYNRTCDQDNGKKSVYAISSYLKVFSPALMINHLFRSIDAIKVIQDDLNLSKESIVTCQIEKDLKEKTLDFVEKSKATTDECNPSLEELKKIIKDQFKTTEDSRIIVFVRERIYTHILKEIFSSKMPEINCEIILGGEGQTKSEVQQVQERFKNGDLKVLFATSVIEEGIDVQKCNMVIKYGHITNETSRIQSRGRARSSDSKYIVIVPPELKWQFNKENINKVRESLMYKAIKEFQKLDKEYKKKKIIDFQISRELMEVSIKPNQTRIACDQSALKTASLNCRKCNVLICTSKDMRLLDEKHHVILNEERFSSMKLSNNVSKNDCAISCAQCENNLGFRRIYENRMFPSLNPKNLSFTFENETVTKTYKVWKDVPLCISEIQKEELVKVKQNHSLSQ